MTKIYLLFCLFLAFVGSKGQTSIYHPFPESNAVWNEYLSFACPPPTHEEDNFSYTFGNDTLIQSNTYHKLITPYVKTFNPNCNGSQRVGYRGAIRQDTSLRKIYFVQPGDSIERVLYDFSVSVGDTFYTCGYFCLPNYEIAHAIDSVFIGSDYRKRWRFQNLGTIIEGIGSIDDLLHVCEPAAAPYNWTLSCFSLNGHTVYPDTSSSCNLILGLNDDIGNSNVISFFPNPFHTSAILKIFNFIYDFTEIKIFDILGKVKQDQAFTLPSTIIDRRNLSNGLYFYQLNDKKGHILKGKFIVE
jgi:hypothetical protein